MIRLFPNLDADYVCPECQVALDIKDWYIPGMRNLADLECPRCKSEFFGDLLAGQALYTPILFNKLSGKIYDPYGVVWFAKWLRDSYANKINEPIDYMVEEFRTPRNVVLLNCLDALYGHSLLKLLNAQYYLDHRSDFDLVVIVPKILRWMVPDGVAAIWTIDLPLERGKEWNDWFAQELKKWVGKFDSCWLSVAYSHPHPEYYSIERFTQVKPFNINEWDDRTPNITFIWRDDRLWADFGIKTPYEWRNSGLSKLIQRKRVLALATRLRMTFPDLEFSITGLGKPGGFPAWVKDLRKEKIDEKVERAWCEQYARSHVVIGIHGSNMLLPSAHAGATVELMPPERWGNYIQDFLFPDLDSRETLYRYRIVPSSISNHDLLFLIKFLIIRQGRFQKRMVKDQVDHHTTDFQ